MQDKHSLLWPLALLLVLSALVWGKTLAFEFVWDDLYFVELNSSIREFSSIPTYFTDKATSAGVGYEHRFALFRPIRNISYLFDFKIAGLQPGWWHAHNVLLHTLNALLVLLISRRLFHTRWASLAAALIFLLHPVQTEVVAWVKCRDDLLSTFWVLAAVLAWLKTRKNLRLAVPLISCCYLLACLSKVQAITLPLLILAIEWLSPGVQSEQPPSTGRPHQLVGRPHRGRRKGAETIALLVLCLIGVAYLAWRHLFIGHTAQTGYLAGSLGATLLTMTRVAVAYLGLLAAPFHQLADYSGMQASTSLLDPRVLLSLVILIGVGLAALALRRSFPLALLGFAWIAIFLLPMSNLVPMMQYMAERFLYLPLVGWALFIAVFIRHIEQRRAAMAGILTLALTAALSIRTLDRSEVWRNEEVLFGVTVRDTPDHVIRPRRNLLIALINSGNIEMARPLAEDIWQRAKSTPSLPVRQRAQYARHLGFIYLQTGESEDGLGLMHKAIEIDPTYGEPYLVLGMIAGMRGDNEQALDWFDRGIGTSPQNANAYFNRGVALQSLGRVQEAEKAFRECIFIGPRNADTHMALANLLWRQGRITETVPLYKEATRIYPDSAEARFWLGRALTVIRQ